MLLGIAPFILSGFVVGALVGMTGVGGGSLMTPLLVLIFGIHPVTAVGTDLLYAAVTKTGGTFVHHRRGTIDWPVTRRLATGSIPAAIATLVVLYELGVRGGGSPPAITIVLACALIMTAICVIAHRKLQMLTLIRGSAPIEPARVILNRTWPEPPGRLVQGGRAFNYTRANSIIGAAWRFAQSAPALSSACWSRCHRLAPVRSV
jgi:uncharacterized membrane protein YfcA